MTDQTIADLDGVFESDEAEETSAKQVTNSTEAEESEAEETEAEETEGEKDAEPPAAEEKSVPYAALKDERRKRQELEEEIKQLRAQKTEKTEEKVPDPIEDPEGYKNFMDNSQKRESLSIKINLSRDIMLDSHTDYEEVEKTFIDLAKANPFLVHQMNASPNPARFAYKTAKEHLEIQQLKDPKYREKLEAELREKILSEMKDKRPDKKKTSAVQVPDLTKATAVASNTSPVEKLEDLNDILRDSPF